MNPRVVTFYSWKGGVGRSFALANVGVQLALSGMRVLLIDWDLEAPGLERYFLAETQGRSDAFILRYCQMLILRSRLWHLKRMEH
jgi:MinD-like ATPase involved in chromosome partitioning or flagellar assembly